MAEVEYNAAGSNAVLRAREEGVPRCLRRLPPPRFPLNHFYGDLLLL